MNVAIGIPVPPNQQANATTIAIAEGWAQATDAKLVIEPSPSPEEGRDKIVAKVNYMVPRPTHILFLDADIVPKKNLLANLMKLDKDIAVGMCPTFQRKFYWNVSKDEDYQPIPIFTDGKVTELPSNPFKIQSCGFGAVLLKTEVLDRMKWPYWKNEYAPGLRTLGEDIYFCQKAKASGCEIWCDPKSKCDHVTRASYLSILRSI